MFPDAILEQAAKAWQPQWYSGEKKDLDDRYYLSNDTNIVRLYDRKSRERVDVFMLAGYLRDYPWFGWYLEPEFGTHFFDKELGREVVKATKMAIPHLQMRFWRKILDEQALKEVEAAFQRWEKVK